MPGNTKDSPLRSVLFGLAIGACAWGVCRGAGEAASLVTVGAGPGEALGSAFLALVAFAAAFVLVFLLRRGPRNVAIIVVSSIAAILLGYGLFAQTIAPTVYPIPDRDRLTWWAPNSNEEERNPRLPHVTYATNAEGFRGPAVGPKAPGTTRIQVIGDSFVFGMGLELPDTLPVQLQKAVSERHPGVPVETINLGVPGNNLLAHVQLFDKADGRYQPDATVLCITENDLSTWTPQALQPQAYQLGLFSFVSYLAGPKAARLAWAGLYALPDGSPEEREAARKLLERAATLAGERKQPLVIFSFPPAYADLVAGVNGRPYVAAGASVATEVEHRFFFPDDGHPTKAGDAYFAKKIAELLDRVPGLEALHEAPKPE